MGSSEQGGGNTIEMTSSSTSSTPITTASNSTKIKLNKETIVNTKIKSKPLVKKIIKSSSPMKRQKLISTANHTSSSEKKTSLPPPSKKIYPTKIPSKKINPTKIPTKRLKTNNTSASKPQPSLKRKIPIKEATRKENQAAKSRPLPS